jgi:hypothetical protein
MNNLIGKRILVVLGGVESSRRARGCIGKMKGGWNGMLEKDEE